MPMRIRLCNHTHIHAHGPPSQPAQYRFQLPGSPLTRMQLPQRGHPIARPSCTARWYHHMLPPRLGALRLMPAWIWCHPISW